VEILTVKCSAISETAEGFGMDFSTLDGWYLGTLRYLKTRPILGAEYDIVVSETVDLEVYEAERNARDGYCGNGEYA